MATTEMPGFVGQPVPRKEDAKLLQGQGRYVDNLTVPGMVWMAVVRSPFAHARIVSVDVSKAAAAEGVVAACSAADLADDWAGSLPCAWPVTEDTKIPDHFPLAARPTRALGSSA